MRFVTKLATLAAIATVTSVAQPALAQSSALTPVVATINVPVKFTYFDIINYTIPTAVNCKLYSNAEVQPYFLVAGGTATFAPTTTTATVSTPAYATFNGIVTVTLHSSIVLLSNEIVGLTPEQIDQKKAAAAIRTAKMYTCSLVGPGGNDLVDTAFQTIVGSKATSKVTQVKANLK